jgi:hypothetical protein
MDTAPTEALPMRRSAMSNANGGTLAGSTVDTDVVAVCVAGVDALLAVANPGHFTRCRRPVTVATMLSTTLDLRLRKKKIPIKWRKQTRRLHTTATSLSA